MIGVVDIRAWCAAHGVARLDAGPQAVALRTVDPAALDRLRHRLPDAQAKEGRLVLPLAIADPGRRLDALKEVLAAAKNA